MTEKFVMKDMHIPEGMLHDQPLCNVSFDNNILTLSFDTNFFSDHAGTPFEKYKEFTKCHIKYKLADDLWFCHAYLETSVDKERKYKARELTIPEFVAFANKEIKERNKNGDHLWDYLYTYVAPDIRAAKIEFCIYSSKYKRTVYQECILELMTEEIEYVWEKA